MGGRGGGSGLKYSIADIKNLQKELRSAKRNESRTKRVFDTAMGGVYAAGWNEDNQRRQKARAATAREKYLKAKEVREKAERQLDRATKKYRRQN